MSRSFSLFVFLITLLAAGCAPATPVLEPLKTDIPPAKSEWTIKMTQSGGIMGLSRSIEISSDGNYTVTDERLNKTITKKLSASGLAELKEIISNIENVRTERTGPSGCADCFIYDLEMQKDGKKFSVQVDDMSMPNSELEPLISYLQDLMNAALK